MLVLGRTGTTFGAVDVTGEGAGGAVVDGCVECAAVVGVTASTRDPDVDSDVDVGVGVRHSGDPSPRSIAAAVNGCSPANCTAPSAGAFDVVAVVSATTTLTSSRVWIFLTTTAGAEAAADWCASKPKIVAPPAAA